MIGQTLNNRFTITARLGKGAMGTVYRATDSQTGKEVAVKSIARELAFDEAMLERFKREGEALRQLRHPNIVGYVDAFHHNPAPSEGAGEQYYIVMEYVTGGSLLDLIKRGQLPTEKVRQIALELCDALTRAHYLNVVHRDLKPENVLMDTDGTPKLTDFGVARMVGDANRLTGTGTQIGTPYYMSPEAWEGKPLDGQSDIWSMGVVMYEMLSGEVPFAGETLVAVMNKVMTAPLPDLKTKRADLPDGLARIVERMLTRDKAARYQSMRELGADLERGGPPAPAPAAVTAPPAADTVGAYAPPTVKIPSPEPESRTREHSGWALAGILLAAIGVLVGPALLLANPESYVKGPLWGAAAVGLTAALAAGLWALRQERAHPSRWGRAEALFDVGVGTVALAALLGLMIFVPRTGGGVATNGSPTLTAAGPEASPTVAPVIVSGDFAAGPVLFEDNFDSGRATGWGHLDEGWRVEQIDGQTVLYGSGPKDGNFATQDSTESDYVLQADYKFIKEASQGAHHIQFFMRWSFTCPEGVDWSSSYAVDVYADRIVLVKGVCDKPREWVTLAEAAHNLDPADWHTIQFAVFGGRVQVGLDGQILIDYVDDTLLPGGDFALVTNDGGEALFDNVRVTRLVSNP